MKAEDKIKYSSIIEKINKTKMENLTEDEYEWLKHHTSLIQKIKKNKQKENILNAMVGNKDTIEEILFNLDLSDRMYR